MHLIIEGRGGDWHKLQDLPALYELLDTLPGRINMTKIMPPIVTRYVGVSPEDWGISGFVMIAESHISVHTFPERGEVAIDVFSCKEFDGALTCDISWKRSDWPKLRPACCVAAWNMALKPRCCQTRWRRM
jgi:S-adenosylmethionine decarboxylase